MNGKNTIATGFQQIGIQLGTQLDTVLGGGFHGGSLNVVASRPGMGKNAFVLQCAAGMAKNTDKKICMFSRDISLDHIKKNFAGSCDQGNLMIDDSTPITLSQVRAKLAEISDLGAVIIDFHLLQSDNGACEQNAAASACKISGELKRIALESEVPVLCNTRLPKKPYKGSRRPGPGELRVCGNLAEVADVILFLHRDADLDVTEEMAGSQATEVIVAKNRYGELRTFLYPLPLPLPLPPLQ